jgi:hypothetical protein
MYFASSLRMIVELIDPKTLEPNPWNSNRVSPENMEKLKRSISELGFASAVVARKVGRTLQILGGQHRTEAAIALGLDKIPVVNLGVIPDEQAKKIGLVDNHRYGNDDTIALAKILEDLGTDPMDMVSILPVGRADIDAIIGMAGIDLDSIGLEPEETEPHEEVASPTRPTKTHEIIKFRLTLGNAEKIRELIKTTTRRHKLEDQDEMTAAGDALALLLLSEPGE